MLKKILSRDNLFPPIELYKKVGNDFIYKNWKLFLSEKNDDKIGLYIHIPFCLTKCSFCHCKSFSGNIKSINNYLEALKNEILVFSKILGNKKISNIYFGGGTPSILTEEQLENFLSFLFKNFNFIEEVPFCFEAMPETLSYKKVDILKKYGVTRLSLGVQTLDNKVLKNINRFQDMIFLKEIILYIKQNIKYLNLDLVCGLEGETFESFKKGLDFILDLNPDIIHIYRFNPSNTTTFTQSGKTYTDKNKENREKMYNYAIKKVLETGRKKLKNDDFGFDLNARNISIIDRIENASSNIGIGYSARSNIFGKLSYVNNGFLDINFLNINEYTAFVYGLKEEKRRYILQNIIDGLDFVKYQYIFNSEVLQDFSQEFSLLFKKYGKESLIFYSGGIKINFEKIPNYIFNLIFYPPNFLKKLKNEIG